MRLVLSFLLLIGLASQAQAQRSYKECDACPGGGGVNGQWYGGLHSLPVGAGSSAGAISRALYLPAVRVLEGEFERRGYVRMPEMDAAFCMPAQTVVAICYAMPGWTVDERQPAILVNTMQRGDVFCTQVLGGVIGGSSTDGLPQFYQDPPPAVVVGSPPAGGGAKGPVLSPDATTLVPDGLPNVDDSFISTYDRNYSYMAPVIVDAWSYSLWSATGYDANVWGQYGAAVASDAAVGGLVGWKTSPPGAQLVNAGWGAFGAFILASQAFWASHPPCPSWPCP